jgi:hypothetical protein
MNWKLILMLSLFGLAMGIATVFIISSAAEPFFWLFIFVVCAYFIVNHCSGKFFLHGFLVSLLNSVWITAAHILLFTYYIGNHAKEAVMMAQMPLPDSPKIMMLITGPVIGVLSGLLLGFFAYLASLIIRKHQIH